MWYLEDCFIIQHAPLLHLLDQIRHVLIPSSSLLLERRDVIMQPLHIPTNRGNQKSSFIARRHASEKKARPHPEVQIGRFLILFRRRHDSVLSSQNFEALVVEVLLRTGGSDSDVADDMVALASLAGDVHQDF